MIGQPKNYSEMLKRIFWFSLLVGILCTLSLGYKSPAINKILNFSSKEWELGPVALPFISVFIPFIIAMLTRMFTLHDKISDIFKIREKFDLKYILLNLARGVNFGVDQGVKKIFIENRDTLMLNTFYKYAPNVDKAVINSQLVATALDRWTWFWSFIEPLIIILISGIAAWIFINFKYALIYFISFVIFILIAILIYPTCKSSAIDEVNDILNDANRRDEISKVFNAL